MKPYILLICTYIITSTYIQAAPTPGLSYNYYEGTWSSLPGFSTLKPVKTGTVTNINLNIRKRDINYGVLWQGNISITTAGTYTFETTSDDGSKIYIDNYSDTSKAVVNNDGEHEAATRTGTIYLTAGTHSFVVAYYNNCCEGVLDVYWSSNSGVKRSQIPDSSFSHVEDNAINNNQETAGMAGTINYYFSNAGNDAYTSEQAQNPATPWKTLAKLNAISSSIKPGTAFLLKRGDVFTGPILITSSGAELNPIILSAYGSGPKPIVTGFTDLNTWTRISENIWQSNLAAGPRLNMLTSMGKVQVRGRYPNADAPNGGYRTYTSHSGFSSITDGSLSASPDWTGAEVSIKSVRWMLNTFKVLSHSGSTINYKGSADTMQLEPINFAGYFIQNDPRTLDQQGEWYYSAANKSVQLFSTSDPSSLAIRAAILDTLFKATNVSFVTLDNIAFEGSNRYSLHFYKGSHVTISNCNIGYSGFNGVKTDQTTDVVFKGNAVSNTNNNGVELYPFCNNSLLESNTVSNSGIIPGMGANGNYANCAMIVNGSGSAIRNNNVLNTGYNGIVMSGSHVEIRHNYVDSFNLHFDDGAGIYTSAEGSNRLIIGNIVLHGTGNAAGTGADSTDCVANGIGLDDYSEYVTIDSNTAAFCSREGVGIHNTHDVIITNNTFFGMGQRGIGMANDILAPNNPIRNITLKHNIFFSTSTLPARSSEGPIIHANALTEIDTRKENFDELTKFGVSDSNFWIKPYYLNLNDFFKMSYRPIPPNTTIGPSQDDSNLYRKYITMDFAHWQSVFNQDAHSVSGLLYSPYRILSQETSTFSNGTFDKNINYVLNPHADKSNPNNNYITQSWDNTHLDKGALQVAYTPASSRSGYSPMEAWLVDQEHGKTFQAGHTYRVKFSIQGSKDGNTDFRCVLRSTSQGESRWMFFKVYDTRTEVELLFSLTSDVPGAFLVIINDDAAHCPTWWLDNVIVQEVGVEYSKLSDNVRFEVNPTSESKTVSLDGTYTDLTNKTYNAQITLLPYSSVILFRKAASITASTTSDSKTFDNMSLQFEPSTQPGLKVVPNPASSYVQVTLPFTTDLQDQHMTIYNITGVTVKSVQLNGKTGPYTVDISDLPIGAYIISTSHHGIPYTSRFIKQ